MEHKKKPNADLSKKRVLFLFTGLLISLAMTLTAFEWKTYSKGELIDLGEVTDNFDELMEIPPTEQPPPEKPPVQQPQVIEIPDDEEIIDEIDFELDVEVTEEEIVENVTFEPMEEEKAEDIFIFVEEEASFPGGKKAWAKFLKKNLTYPRQAKRMNIEGRVHLGFVVDKNGNISDIEVLRSIGGGCDEEAIRVLNASPKWNPGKQRGNPVKSRMQILVVFKLK